MKVSNLVFWLMIILPIIGCKQQDATNSTVDTIYSISTKEQLFYSAVPIETWQNKVFLDAQINDQTFRFILDTGSPTVLTKQAAEALKLNIAGTTTSLDANGNQVSMELATLEQLVIGEVEFQNIPVFILDTQELPVANCLLDGGVIGSEIMPLAKWQINFAEKELILTNDLLQLDYIENANKNRLTTNNYPYAPMLQQTINNSFTDTIMLDTGSPTLLQLGSSTYQRLQEQQLVAAPIIEAYGSFGEAAAGQEQDSIFNLIAINQLSLEQTFFENIHAWTRTEEHSLLGAQIFDSHIVTLDFAGEIAYFYPYQQHIEKNSSLGFKLYIKNQSVHVGLLWENFPAQNAGLSLHDKITKINGVDLTQITQSNQCEIVKRLVETENLDKVELSFVHQEVSKQIFIETKLF